MRIGRRSHERPSAFLEIPLSRYLRPSRQNNSLLGSADLSNITQRVHRCLCLRRDVAWLLAEDMAAKMELAPLRPWDDFFPGTDRFTKPEFGDLTKWNNRVISNLMYYQTNYFAAAMVVFIIVGWVMEGGHDAKAPSLRLISPHTFHWTPS